MIDHEYAYSHLTYADFLRACPKETINGNPHLAYARLIGMYSEPWRFYHTLSHINACLVELEKFKDACSFPSRGTPWDDVEAAIWFHDCVYDTHATDNEEQSALVAEKMLISRPRVGELILDTRHREKPDTHNGMLLCDIDLLPLAADPEQFRKNGEELRKEVSWMDEETFVSKRAAFLATMLKRERIFWTKHYACHEGQARENLRLALRGTA